MMEWEVVWAYPTYILKLNILGVVQKWSIVGNKIMTKPAIVQTVAYSTNILRFKPTCQAF